MQNKPMTRGKLAKFLCTNTKFLGKFIQKENIEVPSRALLTPKVIKEIITKFNGEDKMGEDG
ncbi:MAG: hypothetical protein U5N85_01110 [Arcicella sp.]|nr:hypothetical protein [Arcicella sp.]